MSKFSLKEIVEDTDNDVDEDILVYDFDSDVDGIDGKFYVPQNEENRGIYE